MNLFFGMAAGLGAGVAGVAMAEVLDSGFSTAEEIERRLKTRYLGGVPTLGSVADNTHLAPADYVVAKPLSGFAEAFRNLKTSVVNSRHDEPVKLIAITSALPGEGKTTTSLCLARTSAMRGSRVILVDCDLQRRRAIPPDGGTGLVEVLRGESTLADAIRKDDKTSLHLLPAMGEATNPLDVFESTAMDKLLQQLRANYDLVILDSAPVLPVADSRVLAPKADAVLFIARWRKTSQPAIEAAIGMLQAAGAPLAGVALAMVDMRHQAKFAYGDPSYYYQDYKNYYAD